MTSSTLVLCPADLNRDDVTAQVPMTALAFIDRRSGDWQALERLCARGDLSEAERRTLAASYRVALADLGQLRTLIARAGSSPPPPALAWLNGVVARAHARVALQRRSSAMDVRTFFGRAFPQAFRRAARRVALAATLLVGSAVVSFLICHDDAGLARMLAGPSMARNAEGFAQMGQGRDEITDSVMATFYVTNNVQVSFIAFALGITFGLGTLYILIQNGFILGVTLALVRQLGSTRNFLGFVASHGMIEMAAIVIAAGAGLGMGMALVAPGPHARVDALKLAAREAATLVMGAASMLLLAAFFEAFVSPSALSVRTKAIIGLVNAVWLTIYLARAGRQRDPEDPAPPVHAG
jgi:uncharacterized membrane protein SpoIIM required for sporulation